MANRPPLTDAVMVALARLIDDSQSERHEPAHSDIEFQMDRARLAHADPAKIGSKPIGMTKRVRGTLSWALSNNLPAGELLASGIKSTVQGYGGFRTTSSNYCGKEAIENLLTVFSSQGWDLLPDGSLQPRVLDSLTGKALTAALEAYADRPRRGSLDSPLWLLLLRTFSRRRQLMYLLKSRARTQPTQTFQHCLGKRLLLSASLLPANQKCQKSLYSSRWSARRHTQLGSLLD